MNGRVGEMSKIGAWAIRQLEENETDDINDVINK